MTSPLGVWRRFSRLFFSSSAWLESTPNVCASEFSFQISSALQTLNWYECERETMLTFVNLVPLIQWDTHKGRGLMMRSLKASRPWLSQERWWRLNVQCFSDGNFVIFFLLTSLKRTHSYKTPLSPSRTLHSARVVS